MHSRSVVPKVYLLCESSRAGVTGKQFLTSVDEGVPLQLGWCREILFTLQASVIGTSLPIHISESHFTYPFMCGLN